MFILIPAFLLMTACGGGNGSNPSPSDPSIKLNNFQSANVVIGQADFNGKNANQGGTVDANTLYNPHSVSVHNGVLYTVDGNNNRVLGYNTIPTVNNIHADFVYAQPDFTTRTTGTSKSNLNYPVTPIVNDGKMFLSDFRNNRVLMWDTVPSSGNTPADRVIGQADFNTSVSGCSNTSLRSPAGIMSVGSKLIVTDYQNNRVMVWNTLPTTNGQPADLVLGQQNFNTCIKNDSDANGVTDSATASTLNIPSGVWSDGQRLVIADSYNNRVLIWNTFPTTNAAPADVVLGQSDFNHISVNDDDQDNVSDSSGLATARTLNIPIVGVYSNGTQLFISDSGNHRVLVWNSFPTSNFTPADTVLGQDDFNQLTNNDDDQDGVADTFTSARTLNFPFGILQHDDKLIVADAHNNRVLIFNGQ